MRFWCPPATVRRFIIPGMRLQAMRFRDFLRMQRVRIFMCCADFSEATREKGRSSIFSGWRQAWIPWCWERTKSWGRSVTPITRPAGRMLRIITSMRFFSVPWAVQSRSRRRPVCPNPRFPSQP